MSKEYSSFTEFWPFYVHQHSRHLTRTLHFIGTAAVILLVLLAALYSKYLFLAVPVAGYGFAWAAHFLVEKNRPATFSYPLWSLIADFKMFFLMCAGKMDQEVVRYSNLHEVTRQ
jgi:hypothetical protein